MTDTEYRKFMIQIRQALTPQSPLLAMLAALMTPGAVFIFPVDTVAPTGYSGFVIAAVAVMGWVISYHLMLFITGRKY